MLQKNAIKEIQNAIGYAFKNKQLLTQAFTRAAYHNEHPESPDNEVMEFYGDAILSQVVTRMLVKKHTKQSSHGLFFSQTEGGLTTQRSNLTCNSYLALQIDRLGLKKYLRNGNSPITPSIDVLANLCESLVAAVFLDSRENIKKTTKVVFRLLNLG